MEIVLPKWGMTMQEATVVRWLKGEGDSVEVGESIVDLETDKVDVAIEAPIAGVLAKQCARVGDVIAVGELVAIIDPLP